MNDMTDIHYKDNFEQEIENILNNVTKKEQKIKKMLIKS